MQTGTQSSSLLVLRSLNLHPLFVTKHKLRENFKKVYFPNRISSVPCQSSFPRSPFLRINIVNETVKFPNSDLYYQCYISFSTSSQRLQEGAFLFFILYQKVKCVFQSSFRPYFRFYLFLKDFPDNSSMIFPFLKFYNFYYFHYVFWDPN